MRVNIVIIRIAIQQVHCKQQTAAKVFFVFVLLKKMDPFLVRHFHFALLSLSLFSSLSTFAALLCCWPRLCAHIKIRKEL